MAAKYWELEDKHGGKDRSLPLPTELILHQVSDGSSGVMMPYPGLGISVCVWQVRHVAVAVTFPALVRGRASAILFTGPWCQLFAGLSGRLADGPRVTRPVYLLLMFDSTHVDILGDASWWALA